MIDIEYGKIVQRGKIRFECTLDKAYYNYKSGSETLAFDRIAEKLYNLGSYMEAPFNGVYITLSSTVPVGFEATAVRTPTWLVVDLITTNAEYANSGKFANFMSLITYEVLRRLVTKGVKKAIIEIGDEYHLLNTDD